MAIGRWRDVGVGDIIQSKGPEPHAWKVTGRPTTGPMAGGVVIEREGGYRKAIPREKCPPDGQVKILLSMKAAMDQAIALTQVTLGGKIQAIQGDGDEYRVPVDFIHPGELRAHMWLLHGVPMEAPDEEFTAMVKEHADKHHPDKQGARYLPHVHDPQFLQHLERLRRGEGLR